MAVETDQWNGSRRAFLGALGGMALVAGCADGRVEDLAAGDPEGDPQFRGGDVFGVSVRKAKQEQAIVDDPERCSVSQDLAWLVLPGQQLRIWRSSDEYAVYTVDEIYNDLEATVRMCRDGRKRLGTSQTFDAIIDTQVVASEYSDEEAMEASECVERRVGDTDQTSLIVIAPHGGGMEAHTDTQAQTLAAARGVGSWVCKGWRSGGGAHERWHITSTAIDPASFPELAMIAGVGYDRAISFHGMSAAGVLVGGGAPIEQRQIIADQISLALEGTGLPVNVAQPGDSLSGTSPNNLVNWLTTNGNGGIQIEQSSIVRAEHRQAVVDAISAALDLLESL